MNIISEIKLLNCLFDLKLRNMILHVNIYYPTILTIFKVPLDPCSRTYMIILHDHDLKLINISI